MGANKRIGLLTGGGDAPGLNGILEATSRTLLLNGYEILGIEDGFEGVFEGRVLKIAAQDIENIHTQAGTLLGTSNRSGTTGREKEFLERYQALNLEGLVVIGGDGTFAGLKPFQGLIPMIGVPKTIDNDLAGTEVTFGFDTACSVVANAIEALKASARAHRRIIIVEAMGRTAGWIGLGAGLASFADVILIPERPYQRTRLLEFVRHKLHQGKRGLMISVSEGAHAVGEKMQVAFEVKGSPQAERLGGVSESLARFLEKEVGWEARHVVLGHLQRAQPPTVTDRLLTLSMGVEVAQMVQQGAWGKAVVCRKGQIVRADVSDLMGPARLVDPSHRWVKLAQELKIFI